MLLYHYCVLTMYLDRSKNAANGKTYHRVLLRQSFRLEGKVKHRTVANLSACSQEELQAIELALKHKHNLDSLRPSDPGPLHLRQGLCFGAVWALHHLAQRLGLSEALGFDRQGKLALWQVLARAITLREQAPGRTTPMLVEILAREGQPALKPHTLDTHLRKAGKTRRVLRQAPETHTRFERDHPNELWQSDAMAGPWLPDPAQPERRLRTHLFAFIDDYSRLIPYGEFFFDEALPRLERVLKLSILRRGLPEEIYVDNGQVFHATQFYAACASLRIRVLHARPYHPQGKGIPIAGKKCAYNRGEFA